ncbi:PAS domain-containing protein [Candidatus Fermentibacteria bacterium]|nr:PAS domain-containing protein [Candidatus Fermentibacteria bacterium]
MPLSWAVLLYDEQSGVVSISGDAEKLLGASAEALIGSEDPLSILPESVSRLMAESSPGEVRPITGRGTEGIVRTTDEGTEVIVLGSPETAAGDLQLVEDLAAGVVGADPKGVIHVWNRAMQDIFHVPTDYAIGKRLDDVLKPPLLYGWDSIVARTLDGKQMKVECRPGHDRRIEAKFARGGPGVVGTFLDTTESFLTEKRLRTNRRMNQAYFQSIGTGLVLFGPDFRILISNKSFGRLFGVTDSLLGMPLYEVLPDESFVGIERYAGELFDGSGKEVEPDLVSFQLPDGSTSHVVQSLKPLQSESGEVSYCVGIFEDATRTVEAESKLRLFRERIGKVPEMLQALERESLSEVSRELSLALLDYLSCKAAAVYIADPYSGTTLSGSAGDWNTDLPTDFSDLDLPASVWTRLPGSLLREHELGSLVDHVESCLVLPVGSGSRNTGFILASGCFEESTNELFGLGRMAAELLHRRMTGSRESSEKEQLGYVLQKTTGFIDDVVSSLDTPLAAFSGDWKIIYWNRAMARATGVSEKEASSHPQKAADTLFEPAGGVGSIRRRIGSDSAPVRPMTWNLTSADGESGSYAWRVISTKSPRSDTVEPVTVVSGLPLDQEEGPGKVGVTSELYQGIAESVVEMLSAETESDLTEAVAEALLHSTRASRVTVTLETGAKATRSQRTTEDRQELTRWEIPLERSGAKLGVCELEGGERTDLADEIALVAGVAVSGFRQMRLGSEIIGMQEEERGTQILSDLSGNVIYSVQGDLGSVVEGGPNRVEDLLEGTDLSMIERWIAKAVARGRTVASMHLESGNVRQVVITSMGRRGSEKALLLWQVYEVRPEELGCSPEAVQGHLYSMLAELSDSLRANLLAVGRILEGDDPVNSAVNASVYEFRAMRRILFDLGLIHNALSGPTEQVEAEEILDAVSRREVRRGRRPPDIDIEGDLPRVEGNRDVLVDLLARISELVLLTGSVLLTVRPRSGFAYGPEASLSGVGLSINFKGGMDVAMPVEASRIVEELQSGTLSPEAELGIMALIAELCGGELKGDPGEHTLVLNLPGSA